MNPFFSGNFYDTTVAYTPTVGKGLCKTLKDLIKIQTFPEQGIIVFLLT